MDKKRTEDRRGGAGHCPDEAPHDRRSEARQTSILRLALIDCDGVTQLCRITNVSAQGLQATVFGSVAGESCVSIRVPDEITLRGSIIWVKDRSVGIKLDQALPRSALLRFSGGPGCSGKRRRLPRVQIAASARLSSSGHSYKVELLDISPAGAMVRLPRPLPALGPIVLDVPGLPKIAGQIRWADDSRAGLLFNSAIALQTLTAWIQQLCSAMAEQVAGAGDFGDRAEMDDCTSLAS